MRQVRAKFFCNEVRDIPEYGQKLITLYAVISGSEENKSFSKYTPSGAVNLNISYETMASEFFEEGKEYYLDFTPAQ